MFETESVRAKLAVVPRRDYGEQSRGGRIRTYDFHVPNVARYRAALRPGIPFLITTKIMIQLNLKYLIPDRIAGEPEENTLFFLY